MIRIGESFLLARGRRFYGEETLFLDDKEFVLFIIKKKNEKSDLNVES